jgi:hypothetical protein
MYRSERPNDHIPPHRAWQLLKIDGEFNATEHDRILRCTQCLRLLLVCMESESFGAVLRQVDDSAA